MQQQQQHMQQQHRQRQKTADLKLEGKWFLKCQPAQS
jgi:hypothetical protein